MIGCSTPGDTILYSISKNIKRKYLYTWEITQTQEGTLICINTLQANALTKEAIAGGVIQPLCGYSKLKNEVKCGEEHSRIDFLLQAEDRRNFYVEVKSVTLAEKSMVISLIR